MGKKHIPNREIGIRAAELVYKQDNTLKDEMKRLGLSHTICDAWRQGICAPSAYALANMANCGYDVIYILTGRKSHET